MIVARQARKWTAPCVGQLSLFDDFGAPVVQCPQGLQLVPDHASLLPDAEVAAWAFNDPDEPDVDALVTQPIIKRTVSAADAAPLPIRGPASIFDMAHQRKPITVRMERPQEGASFRRVARDGGVTRCVRIQEQDTAEWQEREAARRARQRPPKPTAKAKTKSRKLVDLVGV